MSKDAVRVMGEVDEAPNTADAVERGEIRNTAQARQNQLKPGSPGST